MANDDRDSLEGSIRAAAGAADWSQAATAAIRGYGDEILGYLVAITRNETDAADAFSIFCEHMWKGLPRFRWECSFRTWAYGVARHAIGRIRRDPHRRRAVPLDDAALERLVQEVRSHTATFLRTETQDKVARLRAQLAPDDQTLLILRINRGLPWRDIARILLTDDAADDADPAAAPEPAAVDRHAAALRKRFERLKTDLKALARAAG